MAPKISARCPRPSVFDLGKTAVFFFSKDEITFCRKPAIFEKNMIFLLFMQKYPFVLSTMYLSVARTVLVYDDIKNSPLNFLSIGAIFIDRRKV